MDEKQRVYGERYPIDEDFLAALAPYAAGQRRRARLRSAGDARRPAPRASTQVHVDAGRRVGMICDERSHDDLPHAPPSSSTRGLVAAGARGRRALDAVAARYAVAITPAMAALIDPATRRSDRAPVRPRSGASSSAGRTSAPIRSATTCTVPVEGIVHRYPDRVLLKLVHVCAVYCRFCFRREMVGPAGARRCSRASARRRARLHRGRSRKSGR